MFFFYSERIIYFYLQTLTHSEMCNQTLRVRKLIQRFPCTENLVLSSTKIEVFYWKYFILKYIQNELFKNRYTSALSHPEASC